MDYHFSRVHHLIVPSVCMPDDALISDTTKLMRSMHACGSAVHILILYAWLFLGTENRARQTYLTNFKFIKCDASHYFSNALVVNGGLKIANIKSKNNCQMSNVI